MICPHRRHVSPTTHSDLFPLLCSPGLLIYVSPCDPTVYPHCLPPHAAPIARLPRNIATASVRRSLGEIHTGASPELIEGVAQVASTIRLLASDRTSGLLYFPESAVERIVATMAEHPDQDPARVIDRFYPSWALGQAAVVRQICDKLDFMGGSGGGGGGGGGAAMASSNSSPATSTAGAAAEDVHFIETAENARLLSEMMMDHTAGHDICLVGPRGSGKSTVAREFAERAGYAAEMGGAGVETVHLVKDTTARDLLQRRSTDAQGNTVWELSPLVHAAVEGRLVVLDGIDRLPSDTLSVLHSLFHHRDLTLFDGTRLVGPERLAERGLSSGVGEGSEETLHISPHFRMLGLAAPHAQQGPGAWLTGETMPLFSFHQMRALGDAASRLLVEGLFPSLREGPGLDAFQKVTQFSDSLGPASSAALDSTADADIANSSSSSSSSAASVVPDIDASAVAGGDVGHQPLSTRQLLRVARRLATFPGEASSAVRSAFMVDLMPPTPRESFEQALSGGGLQPTLRSSTTSPTSPNAYRAAEEGSITRVVEATGKTMFRIGECELPVNTRPSRPELVPDILFYEIPQHLRLLEALMRDVLCGERSHLLIGNQGTGKNKLADYFLMRLGMEREYIQVRWLVSFKGDLTSSLSALPRCDRTNTADISTPQPTIATSHNCSPPPHYLSS